MRAFLKAHPRLVMIGKVVGLLCFLFVVGLVYVAVAPIPTIRRLDKVYNNVQRGMSVEQVDNLMGHHHREYASSMCKTWDWEPLSAAEAARIVSSRVYSVPTFFLPIGYEFTFDAERKLVGKHRLD
jgi:hypothetical protein